MTFPPYQTASTAVSSGTVSILGIGISSVTTSKKICSICAMNSWDGYRNSSISNTHSEELIPAAFVIHSIMISISIPLLSKIIDQFLIQSPLILQMMSTRAEDLRTHTHYQHRPLVDASCTYFDEWTSKVSHMGYLSFEITYSASVDDHLEHCQFGFFQAILTYGHEKEV